ncbi:AAEL002865-PA [Aedes aegypti]|uniref:AAEL002865-PA n=1 Tax=Aedes aegypti TaxID=7159 RepID=Q17GV7_AEDAE|nr:AAEL002865-PA [Aedes aegypti]
MICTCFENLSRSVSVDLENLFTTKFIDSLLQSYFSVTYFVLSFRTYTKKILKIMIEYCIILLSFTFSVLFASLFTGFDRDFDRKTNSYRTFLAHYLKKGLTSLRFVLPIRVWRPPTSELTLRVRASQRSWLLCKMGGSGRSLPPSLSLHSPNGNVLLLVLLLLLLLLILLLNNLK